MPALCSEELIFHGREGGIDPAEYEHSQEVVNVFLILYVIAGNWLLLLFFFFSCLPAMFYSLAEKNNGSKKVLACD